MSVASDALGQVITVKRLQQSVHNGLLDLSQAVRVDSRTSRRVKRVAREYSKWCCTLQETQSILLQPSRLWNVRHHNQDTLVYKQVSLLAKPGRVICYSHTEYALLCETHVIMVPATSI